MEKAEKFAQNAIDLIKQEQERLNKAIQLVVGQICKTKLLSQRLKEKFLLQITYEMAVAQRESEILVKEIDTSIDILESGPIVVPKKEKSMPVQSKFIDIFKGLKEEPLELEKAPKSQEEELEEIKNDFL